MIRTLYRNFRSALDERRHDRRELPEHIYRNAVEVAEGEDGWVRIVPVGSFPFHHNGAHELTREHLEQMVANFEVGAVPLLFDIDHQSLWGYTKAAAWSDALEVRDDGLYCRKPALTPYGEAEVQGQQYRFYSPVYALQATNKRGEPVGAVLLSVAYTNTPYFDEGEIDPAVNSNGPALGPQTTPAQMDRNEIIQIYGLAADATDEQIKEAMVNSKAALDAQQAPPAPEPETAPEPAAEADDAAKLNSRIAKLEQQLAERDQADAATRAETLVNAAVAEGKILPADKAVWVNAAKADFDGTKQQLDARKANSAVPGRVRVPEQQAAAPTASGLPESVLAYVNKQCGVA